MEYTFTDSDSDNEFIFNINEKETLTMIKYLIMNNIFGIYKYCNDNNITDISILNSYIDKYNDYCIKIKDDNLINDLKLENKEYIFNVIKLISKDLIKDFYNNYKNENNNIENLVNYVNSNLTDNIIKKYYD